jgi:ElaB/YqjD/DUF883 family membrane-anchored ribosome-binding protein
MTTLDDAAEDLVLKLRGLDGEIAESDHKLEALRGRMEAVPRDLEGDWNDLTDAVKSFLQKVGEEEQELDRHGQLALQAVTAAHNALGENATAARNEMGEAAAALDALGQQAAALQTDVEAMVQDGVAAPADALEERVRELEQELGRLVDEARAFLTEDVVPAVQRVAEDVRERCQELHRSLTEEHAQAMQQAFDEWSDRIDQLEQYVLEHGYAASHQHALDVVAYALRECQSSSRERVAEVTQVVALVEGQLRQFATEVERAGRELADESGSRLLRELEEAQEAALRALSGLDHVRQELAARSFMQN